MQYRTPRFFAGFVLLCLCLPLYGQKFLQIETFGKPQSKKIYPGAEISYQLRNQDIWHTHTIEDFLIDQNLLVLEDRYVNIKDIQALKFQRSFVQGISTSLFWFGLGWSGFAVVGTLTDGDPDTHYRWSDAIVTGSSLGTALLLDKLLGTKKVKIGKRKNLRLLDISVVPVP